MSVQAHPKNEAELNNSMNYGFSTLKLHNVPPLFHLYNVDVTKPIRGLFIAGQFYGFHGSRSSQFHSLDKEV